MKYTEALELRKQAAKSYDEYYDEYMNDPGRQRLLDKGSVGFPLLLAAALAVPGTVFGSGIGAAVSEAKGNVPTPGGIATGAALGGVTGATLGALAGRAAYKQNRELLTQALRNEAWRYAAMRSQGKINPEKTLV